MQKHTLNLVLASLCFSLTGCYTHTGPQFFSTYPSYTMNSTRMTLGQAVQDALMRSGDPVLAQVHVDTNQNVVILTGYVKKIRQSDTAEQIARQIAGEQNVVNHLIVRQ